MDALLSPEKLQLFLLVAAPGIVALYVRSQFISGKMPPVGEGIIAYLVLSIIYLALIYPILRVMPAPDSSPWWSVPGWFLLLFVSPGVFGLLLGLNVRKGWTRRFLAKFRINTVHPMDTAWDFRFAGCDECWVMVVLKDDTKWRGRLGPNSFASTETAERDLYIERVYEADHYGRWIARESGVWIAHGEIRTIEFWPMK